MARRSAFTENGFALVEMWECTFKNNLKADPGMKAFLENHSFTIKKPLDPRDAFYGGRTNAARLYHRVEEDGEKIKYIDVCSLYPFVNKWRKYPVGHPTVYVGDKCPPIENGEGIIKCTVLPPQKLFHPVLPYKCRGKPNFPLCRTYVEESFQASCPHSLNERAIIGTWISDEVKRALDIGYKVIKMHEVWNYTCTTYNKDRNEGGLFAGYINKFLKLKLEASGWPSGTESDEQKTKFPQDVYEREGLILEREKMLFNPGLRCISKLALNSVG
ncbi:hypothetical protein J437_LFUL018482 [Ladona fulva]|uniref:DNA-directed DNA polymerase n=1 Tax=Ladona fulva TaxID=123851 RepID=A0A8K0JZT8_LADFU|nr:hypothetical protein J437_LFUL018482 [Ladona fulva]